MPTKESMFVDDSIINNCLKQMDELKESGRNDRGVLYGIFRVFRDHGYELKEKEEKYYPTLGYSLKPFVLLFDEIYTDLYRIGEAQQRMIEAKKMVFMGTSFSVNITAIALRIAASNSIDIEIIDPNPIDIGYKHATYFEMSALEYVESFL